MGLRMEHLKLFQLPMRAGNTAHTTHKQHQHRDPCRHPCCPECPLGSLLWDLSKAMRPLLLWLEALAISPRLQV